MPDSTTPATSAASRRSKPGFIDQDLEDAVALAEACHREAAKPELIPRLTEREWLPEEQTALGASLARCRGFIERLQEIRTGSRTRTDEEEEARRALLTALDPIIKGARRKYRDGSAERRAYGIGARLSSASAETLLRTALYAHAQLAPGEGGAAPKDKLKGVLASEIAEVSRLAGKYKDADWAQADAQTKASEVLARLRQEIETVLNPLRRDCQGAADQAFTHRDPTNAAQRQVFGLQPDRALND
jgi:hypothetical protein